MFTGDEDHSISLQTASDWTANYRNSHPGQTKGHFFGKTALESILNQEGCVGLRFYYALNNEGQKQLIITGVDGNENDLYQGQLAERSFNCPPDCGNSNPLNS